MEIQFNGQKHAFKPDMAALRRAEQCIKDKGIQGGIIGLLPQKGDNIITQMSITDWCDFINAVLEIEPSSELPNLTEVGQVSAQIVTAFLGQANPCLLYTSDAADE